MGTFHQMPKRYCIRAGARVGLMSENRVGCSYYRHDDDKPALAYIMKSVFEKEKKNEQYNYSTAGEKYIILIYIYTLMKLVIKV